MTADVKKCVKNIFSRSIFRIFRYVPSKSICSTFEMFPFKLSIDQKDYNILNIPIQI